MKDNYPGILFLRETYSVQGVTILIPDHIEIEIKNKEIDPHWRFIILTGIFS